MSMNPLNITHFTATNALGRGNAASLCALQKHKTGLKPNDFQNCAIQTYIGEVSGLDEVCLPDNLLDFDCRNNRLTYLGLQQDNFSDAVFAAREKYGASRVAVFLGTSTSGVYQTELAYTQLESDNALPKNYNYLKTQNPFSLASFVQQYYQLKSSAHVISTACSSSAKVFASAYRHIEMGFCDAAIVGGVDSLCLSTLYGFNSLQLVSEHICTPWGLDRKGINIGEAAGFALVERADEALDMGLSSGISLLGYGESSDAYHMSTPHPDGFGAAKAMQAALYSAGLNSSDIDYINLHGTATPSNDSAEDKAVVTVFTDAIAASSTKGWTGHTLGAAGITEAIFSCLAIQNNFKPINLNTREIDDSLGAKIIVEDDKASVNYVISNSFGFGGSNCSLIFGRQR